MNRPDTTYRLQISPEFTFTDVDAIIDYLEELGISTIYAAPFFQSRKGSTHGYDVINSFSINKEVGTLEEFKKIRQKLQQKNITWLQDIVPNHMAFDSDNPWIKDIFELGPDSDYYKFFDINWDYKNYQKVMLPFFGDTLESLLNKKELQISVASNGFVLKYYDNLYPLSARSYPVILKYLNDEILFQQFQAFKGGARDWQELKKELFKRLNENISFKEKLENEIEKINKSEEALNEILALQYFMPAHWKITEREINYRRFFTINGLICLKMEDQRVFEHYHKFIQELCTTGLINGLRIDHIDGLFEPEDYVRKLRELLGDDLYIIVEKILEPDEKLPGKWPIEGSSGYDFLAQVNHLFTHQSSESIFNEAYEKIAPNRSDFESLVYRKKLFILKKRMGGELNYLWDLLSKDLLPEIPIDKDGKLWKDALSAILAAFPVYRLYPRTMELNRRQEHLIDTAYSRALEEMPERKKELEYLKLLLCGKAGKDKSSMLYFLKRCQQYSGPLAAKGVEDTSFYIYNRLISHNEVGDSPKNFGLSVDEFHEKMLQRKQDFPLTINATSTHDTKRGEDARMRLNVLSEIPEEWFAAVQSWMEINSAIKKNPNIPNKNEEYFIYQTLVGGMPLNEEPDFFDRTADYLEKVLREAKVHSNWAEPDEEYEKTVKEFLKDILGHKKFTDRFLPFVQKISGYGVLKSLSQLLVKCTAPGIPDIYQGTELWDLSYVDPDNRRPVDYRKRHDFLKEILSLKTADLPEFINKLKETHQSGKIKLFTLFKVLNERRDHQDIFQEGEYIPISGTSEENFIAFARVHNSEWRIIIAPVLVTEYFEPISLDLNKNTLMDIYIDLPEGFPRDWEDIFTGKSINVKNNIRIGELLHDMPVILLKNK